MAADQLRIDSLARIALNTYAACLGQMVLIVGTVAYALPPLEVIRHPAPHPKSAPVPGAGKVSMPDAAARRETPRTGPAARLGWTAVAVAVLAALLSIVLPWLMLRHMRQRIVARNWTPSLGRGPAREVFSAEVLQSDTGKLAFLYVVQLGIALGVIGFAMVVVPIGYFLSGNPIAFGAEILLLAAAAAQFPARARVASWMDHQQRLLDQARKSDSI